MQGPSRFFVQQAFFSGGAIMAMRVKCPNPNCGRQLEAEDKLAGKFVKCPHCKASLHLPEKPPTPATADPLRSFRTTGPGRPRASAGWARGGLLVGFGA